MAKILRCPACGALWRLAGKTLPARCRCGQCGTVFSTDKAETAEVDDEKLKARIAEREAQLAREEARRAREAAQAREGEALMTKIAADMSSFEGGAAPEAAAAAKGLHAEPPADMPEVRPTKSGSAIGRFFAVLFGIAALLAIGVCAALYFHEPILKSVPYLRPVYEKVCTQAPCPGFVWAQRKAFEGTAEVVIGETDDLERPDVRITLRNTSAHPQRMPIIELKILDPAGDTIVQRILEPAEYGIAAQPAVLPAGETVDVLVHVETPLPYDAAGASVSPVELQ